MTPEQSIRARCLDMALQTNVQGPGALLETAGAMERFILTGDPSREPKQATVTIAVEPSEYIDTECWRAAMSVDEARRAAVLSPIPA